MKKYVKPELFYEHYELSQHIADCTWEFQNLTSREICIARPDPEKLPIETEEFVYKLFEKDWICSFFPEDWLDYCYYGGSLDAVLFNS